MSKDGTGSSGGCPCCSRAALDPSVFCPQGFTDERAMISLPKHKMTADEFLAWAENIPSGEGVFELHDGVVVVRHAPAGAALGSTAQAERAGHWEAKFAIAVAFRDAVRRAGLPCHAAVDGPSVRVAPDKTYRPDALLYCGEKVPRGALEVPDPVVIAEVVSPGREGIDYGDKLEDYFSLASLEHYLVIDPLRPSLVHYRRAAGGGVTIHLVKECLLRLDPPGLDVDVSEVLAVPPAAPGADLP